MLQEALSLLPGRLTGQSPQVMLGVAAVGLLLATAGARLSRTLLTLTAVGVGTIVGIHAPAWFGLKIDGIGAAFCGAIVLGTLGFVLHRTLVGLLLSSLLAVEAGAVMWVMRSGGASWTLPKLDRSQAMPAMLSQIWNSLPPGLNPALPLAAGIASGVGILLAVLMPRLSRIVFYSLLGTTLMTLAGALAVQQLYPQWMIHVPTDALTQIGIFGGVVLLAMGIQWVLRPKARDAASEKQSRNDAEEDDATPLVVQSFATNAFPIDQKRQETAARRQRVSSAQS
jgi:hypothetical protein